MGLRVVVVQMVVEKEFIGEAKREKKGVCAIVVTVSSTSGNMETRG